MMDLLGFLSVPPFEDEETDRVARMMDAMLWGFLAIAVLHSVLSLLIYPTPVPALSTLVVVLLVRVGAVALMRRGYVRAVSIALTCFLWTAATGIALAFGGLGSPAQLMTYSSAVLIAGFLLGRRAVLFWSAISILAVSGMLYANVNGLMDAPLVSSTPMSTWAIAGSNVGLVAIMLFAGMDSLENALLRARDQEGALAESNRELEAIRASLEERVAARTQGLVVASEVSRAIASVLDLEELLPLVVDRVRISFGLYYVGVFMLDDVGQWAVLRAGTGEAGHRMLDAGHRLLVGGDSMIGQAAATGQPRIALDVGAEAIRFDNPLLPETRSEMALPMRWQDKVVGALTVQSAAEAAFDETDVATLQAMADQLAVAIRNAQLFAEAQQSLARSESIVRRYVQESWDRLVAGGTDVVGYRLAYGQPQPDDEAWLPAMEEAVVEQTLVTANGDEGEALAALPLTTSGEIIGAIGLRRASGQHWNDEELSFARAVSEQVAQAVERMRLLDETRRSARREAVLRQTSDRVRSQADLDAILKVAVQELQRVMRATRVSIRLTTEPQGSLRTGRGPAGQGNLLPADDATARSR